jgi:hypothetical protein
MTRVFLLVSAVMLLSAAADAATPPQYQRPKEMRAILDDAKVLGAFDVAHPIDGIERVEPARYRVRSGTCAMDVTLIDDPAVKRPPHSYSTWAFVVKAAPLSCK